MRAGNLRHKIAIQEQTDTSDGMGGFSLSWSNVSGMATVPAAIWPLKSKERLDAMKQELQTTHKIRNRYRSGITSKMRAVFVSKTFNIISLINVYEKNKILDMLCLEDA